MLELRVCGGGPGRWWGVVRLAGLDLAPQQPPVHVTLASYCVTAPPPARHGHTRQLDTILQHSVGQLGRQSSLLPPTRLLSSPL